MRKALCLIVLVSLLMASAGCYRYSYVTGLQPSDRKITQWQNIMAWGWGEPDPVYLDKLCPEPIAEFGSYESFPNWLCTLVTLGFWSPQTVYIVPAARPLEAH